MPQCLECSQELKHIEDDCRQKWYTMRYYCPDCLRFFTRIITFKSQSDMVASDTIEEMELKVEE